MIEYVSTIPNVDGIVLSNVEHTNHVLQVKNASFLCISDTAHALTGKGVHVTYLVITEKYHLDLLLMSISHDCMDKDIYVYITNDVASETFKRYNFQVAEIESREKRDLVIYKRGRIR